MPTDCLLTLHDVLRVTQLSKSRLYRYIAANMFPKPIKFDSVSRWSDIEVQEWLERQRNAPRETYNGNAA